ncbi:MAG TPA: D-alanyl-lipoteichoic acid biosynthesis protein DltD [Bacteroidia bacterium]|nr:D-alanyl-lipoteichoic acid biosynthesis protein DltD [Bacteroidia bacterium]
MKLIAKIYKTSYLGKNGVFILISLFVLIVLGAVFIPSFSEDIGDKQLFTLNGENLKYNDDKQVSQFLNSIKKNKGYLCLGTSESSLLNTGNYYDFLNNDTSVNNKFSVLYGAGRTCGIHIPMLLNNKNIVDSLKLIYFINPVYWREDLCRVQKVYWDRYTNYTMCNKVALTETEHKKYFEEVQAYFNQLNFIEKSTQFTEYWLRRIRKSYFQDLKYILNPTSYESNLAFVSDKQLNLSAFESFGKINKEIDTIWNIHRDFKNKNWFNPINEGIDYRYKELISFITLCKDLNVQATYLIGPINERFITNFDAKSLDAYKRTVQKIKDVLVQQNTSYIDASDISALPGTFIDHQHHSSYGAYLIYEKIKSYINE